MKHSSKFLLIGLIGSLCVGPSISWADLEVSASVQIRAVSDFHAPLSSHGTWVAVGSYGRCWRPAGVAVGWQPYCYGNWVWTDCGWYWASDEPWGWACYHYGSWAYDPLYGWVWVPGIEWAPAWVYWRVGGGYCGWAPRGPRGVVVATRNFVFVETAHFHEPVRPATAIVNNTAIINKTTEVGSIRHETRNFAGARAQKVVVNEGPGVEEIRKATGKTVSPISIREAAGRNPVPSEAATKINESRRNEKQPATDKNTPPGEIKTDRKGVPQSPDSDNNPDHVQPSQNPPGQDNPPGKPVKPNKPKKKGNGKG